MNEFIREGSEMKTGRILVLLALVIGLLAGPWQAPAEAEMLGRVGQIKNLDYTGGSWYSDQAGRHHLDLYFGPGAIFCHDRVFGLGFMSPTPPPIPALIAFTSWGPTQPACTSPI